VKLSHEDIDLVDALILLFGAISAVLVGVCYLLQ